MLSRETSCYRPSGLGMSQTQAPGKKISHQAVKMAPGVLSKYTVILVCVVLRTKGEQM